ncbi:hypothetical protein BJ546DRAFT_948744 [Cryomyces antarcticus]
MATEYQCNVGRDKPYQVPVDDGQTSQFSLYPSFTVLSRPVDLPSTSTFWSNIERPDLTPSSHPPHSDTCFHDERVYPSRILGYHAYEYEAEQGSHYRYYNGVHQRIVIPDDTGSRSYLLLLHIEVPSGHNRESIASREARIDNSSLPEIDDKVSVDIQRATMSPMVFVVRMVSSIPSERRVLPARWTLARPRVVYRIRDWGWYNFIDEASAPFTVNSSTQGRCKHARLAEERRVDRVVGQAFPAAAVQMDEEEDRVRNE